MEDYSNQEPKESVCSINILEDYHPEIFKLFHPIQNTTLNY